MAIRYNLQFASHDKSFSIFDLEREHVLSGSTCCSLYHQLPVQTGTLEKIMNYTGCSLSDLLRYRKGSGNVPSRARARRFIDLDDMVRRRVISRTARRYFLAGRQMSLNTLNMIAEDQNVDLLDFVKVETRALPDAHGNLKNSKKVLYLTEW